MWLGGIRVELVCLHVEEEKLGLEGGIDLWLVLIECWLVSDEWQTFSLSRVWSSFRRVIDDTYAWNKISGLSRRSELRACRGNMFVSLNFVAYTILQERPKLSFIKLRNPDGKNELIGKFQIVHLTGFVSPPIYHFQFLQRDVSNATYIRLITHYSILRGNRTKLTKWLFFRVVIHQ